MSGSSPYADSGDESPKKGKREDDSKVPKEVFLFSSALPSLYKHSVTCLSSYPEFRMMGGRRRLKNKVCLND